MKDTKKWKIEWDLSKYYKSPKDPQIEIDVQETEEKISNFVKKYTKNKAYLENPKALFEMFKEEEKISLLDGLNKPLRYFYALIDSGKATPDVYKKDNLITERLKKAGNLMLPITLEIGKIPVSKQKEFLKSPELKEYKYYLEQYFESAKHQLSEKEEKIITLKNGPASSMWTDGLEKALQKKTVVLDGKKISLGEASYKMHELPTKKRRALYKDIMNELLSLSDYAEGELNAVIYNKKISDELRGYKNAYDRPFFGHEMQSDTVLKFTKLVTKNFKIAHKFYKIKAKLLNLSDFSYEDRGAKIGKINKKFPFEKSASLLYDVLDKVDPFFSETLNDFLKNGQVDVHPREKKRGGAYQSSSSLMPTLIFLNHVDTFDSLNTLAHEFGHAFHSELTKLKQPLHYQGYSLAVAETASTLFENFTFKEVVSELSEKEKIIALHDKIEGKIATIFRQVAAFNFEIELHERIRKEGHLSHEEIAEMMAKHLKSYCGPAMKITDHNGYTFINWMHFRSPFYVYTYAFGELISDALFAKYEEDPKFIEKIKDLLSAGCSMSPKEIFKKHAGIDINDISFFEKGLNKIKKEIIQLEKLVG
jgi:oligoendopeptidase F